MSCIEYVLNTRASTAQVFTQHIHIGKESLFVNHLETIPCNLIFSLSIIRIIRSGTVKSLIEDSFE